MGYLITLGTIVSFYFISEATKAAWKRKLSKVSGITLTCVGLSYMWFLILIAVPYVATNDTTPLVRAVFG